MSLITLQMALPMIYHCSYISYKTSSVVENPLSVSDGRPDGLCGTPSLLSSGYQASILRVQRPRREDNNAHMCNIHVLTIYGSVGIS
jgi:hypothetical protein